jgi:hypothetical protein
MNTLKDFYYFYKEIPEDKWCTGTYKIDDKCCAYGHLGSYSNYDSPKSDKVTELIGSNYLHVINDGEDEEYPQFTPKQRVLAFLIDKINEKEDSTFKG